MLANRVRELTTTEGTGTLSLNGPVLRMIAFSEVYEESDTVPYCIEDGVYFEIGLGTLGADASTLERTTVYETLSASGYSTSGTPLSLSGTAQVYVTVSSQFLLPIDSHVSDTDNPHNVTKTQVGLGDVDNTADADKPVSTATQTALNLKFDKSGGAITGHVSIGSSKRFRVGGTPRTDWSTSYDVAEVGNSAVIMATVGGLGSWFGDNWYYDGAYKYRGSGTATQYYSNNAGKHVFRTAASGIADDPLTWTDALVLSGTAATFAGDLKIGDAENNVPRTIRLLENTGNGFQGGYVQYDGLANSFVIGVHDAIDSDTDNDFAVLTIDRNSGALLCSGKFTSTNGAKISVQNKVDGGSSHGICWWDTDDTDNVSYMGQQGAGKSAGGGAASAGFTGRLGYMIRNRIATSAARSFLWENAGEVALMELTADTGDLYTKGNSYSNNFLARFKGDAANPVFAIDYDGGGSATGVFGRGDIGAELFGITVAGVEACRWDASQNATFAGSITAPLLQGDSTTGAFDLYGGPGLTGANIQLYAASHATNANDIAFLAAGSTKLDWDNSANQWNLNNNKLVGNEFVGRYLTRGSAVSDILISAGDIAGAGANMLMYGQSQATNANDILFRSGSTARLQWDDSNTHWNFQGRDIVGIGSLTAAGRVTSATATLSALPTYADDAAAGSGGLTEGMLYKTAAGAVHVKLA